MGEVDIREKERGKKKKKVVSAVFVKDVDAGTVAVSDFLSAALIDRRSSFSISFF